MKGPLRNEKTYRIDFQLGISTVRINCKLLPTIASNGRKTRLKAKWSFLADTRVISDTSLQRESTGFGLGNCLKMVNSDRLWGIITMSCWHYIHSHGITQSEVFDYSFKHLFISILYGLCLFIYFGHYGDMVYVFLFILVIVATPPYCSLGFLVASCQGKNIVPITPMSQFLPRP